MDYRFLYGNPVLPVVPLDTACGGVFIVGAYPSARFATLKGVADVPVDNNPGPFSTMDIKTSGADREGRSS